MSQNSTRDLIEKLLIRRGITDIAEQKAFLNPDYSLLSDPSTMHGVDIAVGLIYQAMERGEKIAVYADYDADGIPGAALCHAFFEQYGYDNHTIYIPHRHREGYGLHKPAIQKLHEDGVSLIITVDLGITAVAEVAYAESLGITVIVTDHHEPGIELPQCTIVHPKLGNYSDPMICGCATAFQLVRALIAKCPQPDLFPTGFEKWLLDYVGIATIGDMVPLVKENRILARYGLIVLQKSKRPGVMALCRELDINQSQLTEDDLGYTIIPRLNAASRMSDPIHAYELLSTRTLEVAQKYSVELSELNTRRKSEVSSIMKQAKREAEKMIESKIVMVGSASWNVGVIGIVAGKLCEEYRKPTFVWTEYDGDYIKGSCRSDGIVSVVDLMQSCADLFSYFGGHAGAGGFTFHKKNLSLIETALSDAYVQISATHPQVENMDQESLNYDHELSLSEVTMRLYNDLTVLAPFGVGNPRPVFLIRNVVVSSAAFLGKGTDHIKLAVTDGEGRSKADVIAFNLNENDPVRELATGDVCDMTVCIESNTFRGRTSLRLRPIQVVK
jgi:single-stranded-DNA-specific exonuclease